MNRAAMVLCGGRSARMGRDKATLPFGAGETLLQQVVRRLGECVSTEHIVCVARAGQVLPALPSEVHVVYDREPGGGPLAAFDAGLLALEDGGESVFVCGCDVPLLRPAFVTRMFELLEGHEIAAPHDGDRWHPLAGVYRTDILAKVDALLGTGERSLHALLNRCNAQRVSMDEVRLADPELLSLLSCNTPEEYEAVLQRAIAIGNVPPS
jgi:molybdopterin-guanine dinucleotide biosynthesis protein A